MREESVAGAHLAEGQAQAQACSRLGAAADGRPALFPTPNRHGLKHKGVLFLHRQNQEVGT